CGRHGEDPGDATVALAVTYAGRALCQQELAVGPGAPGWAGPAVLDGARVVGSALYVHPAWAGHPPAPAVLSPSAGPVPLVGPGVLATATGPDAATVRRGLAAAADHLAGAGPVDGRD